MYPDQTIEKDVANQLLMAGGRELSRFMDQLASWLLLSFGAVFALLLANVDAIVDHVSMETLIDAGTIFLYAGIAGVIQKFMASHVAAMGASYDAFSTIINEFAKHDTKVNWNTLFEKMRDALWLIGRWSFNKAVERMAVGDLTYSGRVCARLSEIQRLIVLVETGLLITAAVKIVSGLR